MRRSRIQRVNWHERTFTGLFSSAPRFRKVAGTNPSPVAVGDFNNDGEDDLVVANCASNSVSVLLGNGDGTFAPAHSFPAGSSSPQAVAIGDFDNDGNLDVAVACSDSTNVSVLFGNGDATFYSTQLVFAGTSPYALVVAD